jgi:hypothetical protein
LKQGDDKVDDAKTNQFDGFAIIEEAALTMLGVPDEAGTLETYREHLERLLLKSLGDRQAAAALAVKLVEIIALRHKEIALSAAANPTETIQ